MTCRGQHSTDYRSNKFYHFYHRLLQVKTQDYNTFSIHKTANERRSKPFFKVEAKKKGKPVKASLKVTCCQKSDASAFQVDQFSKQFINGGDDF